MVSMSKAPDDDPRTLALKSPGHRRRTRRWTAAFIVVVAGALTLAGTSGPALASDRGHDAGKDKDAFEQVNLVSDIPDLAPLTDPNVKNPWGIAFGPAGKMATPLWVANNFNPASVCDQCVPAPETLLTQVTVYTGANGHDPFKKLDLEVTASAPTGIVFNPTNSFEVTQAGTTAAARFLFNETVPSPQGNPVGEVTGWSNATTPPPTTTEVAATKDPALYFGMTLIPGNSGKSGWDGPVLLVADGLNGTIDVYNGVFKKLAKPDAFVDKQAQKDSIPPYNVAYLNGRVYVTYASLDGSNSAVSLFKTDGTFIRRLVTNGPLAGPWGMAIAPEDWGDFGGDLLVGNVGDGKINAFNPRNGHFRGTISDSHGNPLVNLGLWGIAFGNGVIGTPDTLIFAAGIGDEISEHVYEHGLVGLIEPVKHEPDDD